MKQKTVTLFVKWKVKEGKTEQVLELMKDAAAASTAESGNLAYKVHQSNTDADTILLYEVYRDEEALAAHRASEHFKAIVLEQIVPLLEQREVTLASELF